MSDIDINNHFLTHLKIFDAEVRAGLRNLYTYWSIRTVIGDNEGILKQVNETPLMWQTLLASLEVSFFMALGRIFDNESEYNVAALLNIVQNNRELLFSLDSLRARKKEVFGSNEDELEIYLEASYVPTIADNRCMKKYIAKLRNIYELRYKTIRHKIHAHREVHGADAEQLYQLTKLHEIGKLFVSLDQLNIILWELYHNGRRPKIRKLPASVPLILKKEFKKHSQVSLQQRVVNDVRVFFEPYKIIKTQPAVE